MALTNYKVNETYKDLLTVLGGTANEGLESNAKRVFDGNGTGSPLYLGTNSLSIVGATTITGDTTVTGTLTVDNKIKLESISSLPNSPSTGDIVLHGGDLYLAL